MGWDSFVHSLTSCQGELQVASQSTESPKYVLPVRREESVNVHLERPSLLLSKVPNSDGISHPVWHFCLNAPFPTINWAILSHAFIQKKVDYKIHFCTSWRCYLLCCFNYWPIVSLSVRTLPSLPHLLIKNKNHQWSHSPHDKGIKCHGHRASILVWTTPLYPSLAHRNRKTLSGPKEQSCPWDKLLI